jgi:hypothetical protein
VQISSAFLPSGIAIDFQLHLFLMNGDHPVQPPGSCRLLKNKFREGQTPNIWYASLLNHFAGASSRTSSPSFHLTSRKICCIIRNASNRRFPAFARRWTGVLVCPRPFAGSHEARCASRCAETSTEVNTEVINDQVQRLSPSQRSCRRS